MLLAIVAAVLATGCGAPTSVNDPARPVTAGVEETETATSTEGTETTSAGPAEVDFEDRSWTGGSAQLPVGWSEIVRGEGWWDLHDPQERRILRIRMDAVGGAPADEALAELERLTAAAGFEEVDARDLGPSGPDGIWAVGAEIRYRYDRDGERREATLRYLGDESATYLVIGLLTGPDEHDAWLGVLDRLHETLQPAG